MAKTVNFGPQIQDFLEAEYGDEVRDSMVSVAQVTQNALNEQYKDVETFEKTTNQYISTLNTAINTTKGYRDEALASKNAAAQSASNAATSASNAASYMNTTKSYMDTTKSYMDKTEGYKNAAHDYMLMSEGFANDAEDARDVAINLIRNAKVWIDTTDGCLYQEMDIAIENIEMSDDGYIYWCYENGTEDDTIGEIMTGEDIEIETDTPINGYVPKEP